MMSTSEIKQKMLFEFENQFETIFKEYFEKKLTFDDCISNINIFITVWDFCRVDIKNFGIESNLIKINQAKNFLKVSFPDWFASEEGQGCKIETMKKPFDLDFSCINDGNLRFFLRGIDYRDLHGFRKPVLINYTNFLFNNENIFDKNHCQWHDDTFIFERFCQNNDVINIKIQFKTIYDYFPLLKSFFNNINNHQDLVREYENIKKYITYEKSIQSIDNNSLPLQDLPSLLNLLNNNINVLSTFYNEKILSLENEFKEYKKDNESIINSYYELFNTIFLYYDFTAKGFLKFNHDLNQEILDFVVNICDKYELDYWVDYGLLLGAVRHNGFIPWDDDIDIGMIREDYDKFLKVITEEIEQSDLSDVLKISLNMHYYKPLPVLQLLYYCEEVEDTIIAGIDIFPYDFIGDISYCNEFNYKKVQKSVTNNNRNGMPIGEALQEYYDFFNISYAKQKYIIPGVEGARGNFSGYKFQIFNTEDIYPLKCVEFENKKYKAPNNSDMYLKQTYGDYLDIPKVIHNHHDRFDKLREREDGLKIFEKNILKMKKINKSFS